MPPERFAKPRAGTALARASLECLQAATEQGEVTITCNLIGSDFAISSLPDLNPASAD